MLFIVIMLAMLAVMLVKMVQTRSVFDEIEQELLKQQQSKVDTLYN